MKAKILLLLTISSGLISCGKVDETTTTGPEAKFAELKLVGKYTMDSFSCSSGQFNAALATDILNKNENLIRLQRDNLSVLIELSGNQVKTTASSTLYGGNGAACNVITIASASLQNQKLSLQDKSRSCSSTCSTDDCIEQKQTANAPIDVFNLEQDGKNLKLISASSAGNICVSGNQKTPYQINWTRK